MEKQKPCTILEGRAPKKGSINRQEKKRRSSQKTEKYSNFDVLVPEMKKLVICVFTVEHTDMTLNVNARGGVKRHHTNNSAFFCLFYFD